MDKRSSRHWINSWKESAEKLSGNSIIEISSDNRVLVEGHLGICQYQSDTIRVRIQTGCAAISGEKLYLDKMTSESIILGISFGAISLLMTFYAYSKSFSYICNDYDK